MPSEPLSSPDSAMEAAPDLFSPRTSPTRSPVFKSYWYLAAERQRIFFKKIEDVSPPYTDDPILQTYKFTNAYRASDRVSQYLIREVIYDPYTDEEQGESVEDTFFRILLFKIFNRVSTWERLNEEVGPIHVDTFDVEHYEQVLESAMQNGYSIYSGAYLMASGKHAFGKSRKHQNHLRLLQKMLDEDVPQRVAEAPSMEAVYELLLSYPTIGTFLAYQYATDLNYSTLTDFSEKEFVMPGPGAESGIKKCFQDPGDYDERELIRWMTDNQDRFFDEYDLDFQDLWGRELKLIDCQNLFCEVDKYARRRHPDVEGTKGRSHIKQKYSPSLEPIPYYYPPDWGINEKTPFDWKSQ